MGRHQRPELPAQENQIIHLGARPLPDGNIEMMVIVRLFDNSYQLNKIVSLTEYCTTLEGLDLCAKTAIHQAHQRELTQLPAAPPANGSVNPSLLRSESAPPAVASPSNGTSMAPTRVPGVQTSRPAPTSASGNAGRPNAIQPAPIPATCKSIDPASFPNNQR